MNSKHEKCDKLYILCHYIMILWPPRKTKNDQRAQGTFLEPGKAALHSTSAHTPQPQRAYCPWQVGHKAQGWLMPKAPTCTAKSVVTQPTRTSSGTAHCSSSRWICLMLLGVIHSPPSSPLASPFLSSNPFSSSSSSLGTPSPLSFWNNRTHRHPAYRRAGKSHCVIVGRSEVSGSYQQLLQFKIDIRQRVSPEHEGTKF